MDTALAAIGQYAKLKNGLFIKRHPITEAEFLDAGAAEQAKAGLRGCPGAVRRFDAGQDRGGTHRVPNRGADAVAGA